MERGRILIVSMDKESAYEVRNLFDNERYEVEIALGVDVARAVLSERLMNLVIMDSAILKRDNCGLVDFILDRNLGVPILVLGPEATGFKEKLPPDGHYWFLDRPEAGPIEQETVLSLVRAI